MSFAGTLGAAVEITTLAIALHTISEVQHKRWHEEGIAHKHYGKTKDGRIKVKRVKGGKRAGGFKTNRRTRKKYRTSGSIF